MAISLKQYEPQVKVSGKGTGVQLDPNLAAQAASAEFIQDQVMIEAFNTLGVGIENYVKQKDEAEILKLNNELSIAQSAFVNEINTETDIKTINKFTNDWVASQENKVNISKLTPKKKKEAIANLNVFLNKQRELSNDRIRKLTIADQDRAFIDTQINAQRGNLVINPDTNMPFESLQEQYSWAGLRRVNLGTEDYEAYSKSVLTFEDDRKKVLENDAVSLIRQDMRNNNVDTIKAIEETLSGKENHYPDISSDKLRSMLVEANQIESENQKTYYTDMYLTEGYNDLSRQERKQKIIEARNQGLITEEVALAEFKRAESPTNEDIRPDDFLTIAQAFQEIRQAGANNTKLNNIINKYAGMALPPEALTKITNKAFAASDVKTRLNTEEFFAAENEALRKFDNLYFEEEILEKAGGWFDKNYPAASKKERKEIREQLRDMAESELIIRLEEFAMSGDQLKTLGELNSQAFVILNDIKRRYQAEQAQDRIDELGLRMLESERVYTGSESDLRARLQAVKGQ